ncbi:FliH/SctL family protein [Alicyclobacillus shizuokensis]|uniref:FliH/SctL family protein n=1 Tax=Alicyclobacillus shizuokensis TaxID=392014 RepID=UPI000AAA7FC1|nr:FliH/SctL family protein [Alicyclobacillus shizuokensis]
MLKHTTQIWPPVESVTIEGPAVAVAQEAVDIEVSGAAASEVAERMGLEESLARARQQADEIVSEAQRHAQRVLEDARRTEEQIHAQAREAGFAAGFQQGLEQGEAKAREAWLERIAQAQAIVAQAETQRVRLLQAARPLLVGIAMEAVRVLLRRELTLAPAQIEEIVQELLDYVLEGSHVEVRVHPDDFRQANEAQPRWRLGKPGDWDIAVVPDPDISPGGCEVRSEAGRLDARIETKLELLEQVLPQLLERGSEDG